MSQEKTFLLLEVFRAASLIPLNQFEVWISRRLQHPSPPGFAFSKSSFLKQQHKGLQLPHELPIQAPGTGFLGCTWPRLPGNIWPRGPSAELDDPL